MVLNDRENRHPAKRTTDVVVKARKPLLEALSRGDTPLRLALVERNAKQRRALPVRAKSMHLAVGQEQDEDKL